ncbi:MAG: pyruvate ferredoxin oxidoreductase subunit gamma [Candidatus Bathyarchaeia archaeon]
MLVEFRLHGRGGQGAVTAAQLLAYAAHIEGKYVQAFPFFGAERRGAPLRAFARVSNRPILTHSQVYNPDYVLVLDPQLCMIVDVTEGLKEDGIIVLNTSKHPAELKLGNWRAATVDATGIALELGLLMAGQPVVNTSMVAAFAGASGVVRLDSVLKAIKENWRGSVREKNAHAAELAYVRLVKWW